MKKTWSKKTPRDTVPLRLPTVFVKGGDDQTICTLLAMCMANFWEKRPHFYTAVLELNPKNAKFENATYSKKDLNSWECWFFFGGGGQGWHSLTLLLISFMHFFANFPEVTWLLANVMKAISSLLHFLPFPYYTADLRWLVMLLSTKKH